MTTILTQSIKLNQKTRQRIVDEANYILGTRHTIRTTARKFGVSKSTVHKDMREKLHMIDPVLSAKVQQVLDYHLSIRHIRGGKQ